MTRTTLMFAAVVVAAMLLVAGCGTTKTVTRLVRPCKTDTQMSRCVLQIVNASRAFSHESVVLNVRCHGQSAVRYGCVTRIDGGCYRALMQRTRSGAVAFLDTGIEKAARCDALFGKA